MNRYLFVWFFVSSVQSFLFAENVKCPAIEVQSHSDYYIMSFQKDVGAEDFVAELYLIRNGEEDLVGVVYVDDTFEGAMYPAFVFRDLGEEGLVEIRYKNNLESNFFVTRQLNPEDLVQERTESGQSGDADENKSGEHKLSARQ